MSIGRLLIKGAIVWRESREEFGPDGIYWGHAARVLLQAKNENEMEAIIILNQVSRRSNSKREED